MNLRMKGTLSDGHCAGEADGIAARRHSINGETLRLQPLGDLGDVRLTHAEAVGKLFMRQPLMIEGGGGILYGLEQRIQTGILRGARPEVESHAMQYRRTVEETLIVFRSSKGMDSPLERRD